MTTIGDELIERNRLAVRSIKEQKNQIVEQELFGFIRSKFGSDSTNTMQSVKARGEFVTYAQVDKIDFIFDDSIVFSVEIKLKGDKYFCNTTRFY